MAPAQVYTAWKPRSRAQHFDTQRNG